ncbi:MAG: S41 family peptidase [Azospirillaceae bacterium]|nr:S41 family peptidase [Azospirillaceae bacterium]
MAPASRRSVFVRAAADVATACAQARGVLVLGALTLALGLGACAGSGSPPSGATLSEQFYRSAYGRIDELYLDPVDLRRLVVDGLVHTGERVPGIVVTALAANARTVTITLGGPGSVLGTKTQARTFPLPDGADANAWAHLAAGVTEWVVAKSPDLAAKGGDQAREAVYRTMMEGAAADLDPYSRYTAPGAARDERARRDGYDGIGVTLEETPTGFRIIAVAPGSPAATAGLLVGDLIIAVGGIPVAPRAGLLPAGGDPDILPPMDIKTVMARLSGPPGTGVPVRLSRGDAVLTITVGRQRIILPTVMAERAGAAGVLHVSRFNAGTADAVKAAVRRFRDAGAAEGGPPTGWVLDLRGNTGGLLDQAVAVADLFITSGPILTTIGRHPDSRQHYEATPGDILDGAPLVVLADGQTASAAEVVLGALIDSGRALDVGTTSFGKGVVQTVTRLPNGGELFITWSRIVNPAGHSFDHQGLAPALCTSGRTDAAAILASLRTSSRPVVMTHGDACPAEHNRPAPVDLTVAENLLANPALLRRAQLAGQPLLADQPAPNPVAAQ